MSFWIPGEEYPRNIAIIDDSLKKSFSYEDLYKDVGLVAKIVSEQNKKLILLLIDNSYLSIVFYLSVLFSDYAAILLDQNLDKSFLTEIIDIYQPDIIFSKENIDDIQSDYLSFLKVVNNQNFHLYRIKEVSSENIHPDLAIMLPTSGSTGSSKFVKLSKKNIISNAKSIVEYLKIVSTDNAITSLPMHYSFGLSVVNTHLETGATITCTNSSIVEKRFWETFNEYKCNTFSGVPYTYQILEKLKFDFMKLSTLRYFTQAGGHLNSKTKKYFLEFAAKNNKEFIVMYGQTEATARISFVPLKSLKLKIDSIGIPIPMGKLKIYDDGKEIAEVGRIGELVYSGDNVMMGYATDRESLIIGDELRGILYTGDLGYKDEDGFFYVTGRMKRFIKVYGNRINLDDVERLIENNFDLVAAVTGIDDQLYILLENSDERVKRKIISFISSKMSLHFSCMKFEGIKKIPLTQNRKKDYSLIKKMFE